LPPSPLTSIGHTGTKLLKVPAELRTMPVTALKYTVVSGREGDLEAGHEPFVEGKFPSREEAVAFVEEWNRLSYQNYFWVQE